ncbi:MAG: long-chain fatty acid--CoA ligase [Sphingomonadales bacterium]|nr:long-chain fatty acid--CoA ligase [Sphingomonadales bacterium]
MGDDFRDDVPQEFWGRVRYAHPCDWEQAFPPLSLPAMFEASATAHPDRTLVHFNGRRWSYARLLADARRFAAGLARAGIGKGDRVGLFLPNAPVYVPAYFGALMAGATLVNFSPLYTAEELEAQVADSGARLLVTLDVEALLPKALRVLRESALEKLVVARLARMVPWWQGLALRTVARKQVVPLPRDPDVLDWQAMLAEPSGALPAIDPEHDIALLQYTGGTTGAPKGAILTHQNLTANARQVRAIDDEADERDVTLGVLPLFHVFAMTCILNRTVLDGGKVVMLARFDAGQVLAAIHRHRPTSIFAVPTMLQALLDDPRCEGTSFASVREVISGGAPLPQPVKERFEALTGAKVVEGYGLTECSGVVSCNPLGHRPGQGVGRAGTIGQPLPGTRLRLLDRDDACHDAAPGEPGELAVNGPQVMQGYWKRPDAEAATFAECGGTRWLRTGDVAVIDADGFVRIVDRIKDMIAVGGFKVYPSEVEAVLLQNPLVREALVIGAPDPYKGEVPRAFVTCHAACDAGELRQWLNDRIGKHERVDAVVIRDALPKTPIGKLDRKALRAELG